MHKILLRPEYFCPPIWENGDDPDWVGPIDVETLPISDDLAQAIEEWADQYQMTFDDDYPQGSDFESPEAARLFDETGHRLWRRLREELGPAYEVTYKSIVTRKYYEPPPSTG